MFKVFILGTVIALSIFPTVAIAQLVQDRCSELKGIYVLPRGVTFPWDVSGQCLNVDGKPHPYLTQADYDKLEKKPEAIVFY
jgi:hypothetical protein